MEFLGRSSSEVAMTLPVEASRITTPNAVRATTWRPSGVKQRAREERVVTLPGHVARGVSLGLQEIAVETESARRARWIIAVASAIRRSC